MSVARTMAEFAAAALEGSSVFLLPERGLLVAYVVQEAPCRDERRQRSELFTALADAVAHRMSVAGKATYANRDGKEAAVMLLRPMDGLPVSLPSIRREWRKLVRWAERRQVVRAYI